MREVCSWFDLLQHLQFCKGFRQLLSEKGGKKRLCTTEIIQQRDAVLSLEATTHDTAGITGWYQAPANSWCMRSLTGK